ncbi:Armadillo-type fold containing protein [Trema orientale]|uniref:Armadillo-type fold containing protein n=1 Tax=Trema orientale TaxID=63057 RepID=A0A2P5C9W5_TREOI|nr:Armadillo-type fold containing protein [Trema orientale]
MSEAGKEIVGDGPSEEFTAPQVIDDYELVDPIDILTPLHESGFFERVEATKGSEVEQKDVVAELTKLASAERISPGDFTRLIADGNNIVALEALEAVGNLAWGLRTHFSGSSLLLPVLFEKYKEEEPVLTGALNQSLDAIREARCLSLTDIVEGNIELSDRAIILKVRKDYAPIFMECLNDGIPEVREAAFFALGEMVKLVGFKVLESSLVGLDDERRHQLIEMIPGGHEPQPSANLLVIPTELDEMLREALESVMARLQVEESEVNENVDEEDEDFEIREAELEDVPLNGYVVAAEIAEMLPLVLLVEPGKMMMTMNESRRRLGSFQICVLAVEELKGSACHLHVAVPSIETFPTDLLASVLSLPRSQIVIPGDCTMLGIA